MNTVSTDLTVSACQIVWNGVATCDFNDLDNEKGTHVFSIGNEPNFYWQGPDGQSLLRRATTYERNGLLG